jgi:outer membrane protein TolC
MKILFLLTPALLMHAITFNQLCEHAYNASDELIQTQGNIDASGHLKSSALATNPLALHIASSAVQGADSADSGWQYGAMVNYSLKKSASSDTTALLYDSDKQLLTQEALLIRQNLQISLKHDWFITLIEQERVAILQEAVNATQKSYEIGRQKVDAGRMSRMELQRLAVEKENALQALYVGKMEEDHIQEILKETTMIDEKIVVDDKPFAFVTTTSISQEQIKNSAHLQKIQSRITSLDLQAKSSHYDGNDAYTIGLGATHEPTQDSLDVALTIPLIFGEKNEKKAAALMTQKSSLVHASVMTAKKLQIHLNVLLEHLHFKEKRYNDALNAQETKKSLLTMSQKGYEAGAVSQFEHIATQKEYFDSRLLCLELKRDYINELAQLEEKLGETIQ